jgi:hypothetical protein
MTAVAPRTTSRTGKSTAGPAGIGPAGPAGSRPRQRTHRAAASGDRLRDLAAGFAAIYLEVESGRRNPAQIAQVMERKLYVQLERVWIRPAIPGKVVSVIGHLVSRDAYEAVAVVQRGDRFGSLAIRLARQESRWVVVDASRPEDGPLPEPVIPIPVDEHDAFDLVGDAQAACSSVGERALVPLA